MQLRRSPAPAADRMTNTCEDSVFGRQPSFLYTYAWRDPGFGHLSEMCYNELILGDIQLEGNL